MSLFLGCRQWGDQAFIAILKVDKHIIPYSTRNTFSLDTCEKCYHVFFSSWRQQEGDQVVMTMLKLVLNSYWAVSPSQDSICWIIVGEYVQSEGLQTILCWRQWSWVCTWNFRCDLSCYKQIKQGFLWPWWTIFCFHTLGQSWWSPPSATILTWYRGHRGDVGGSSIMRPFITLWFGWAFSILDTAARASQALPNILL